MLRLKWGSAMVVGLLLLASASVACGESQDESDLASTDTVTPAATVTPSPGNLTPTSSAVNMPTPAQATDEAGGAGGGEEGTVVPVVSPLPILSVPEEWVTFRDSDAGFSFRYPSNWYAIPELRRVQSWDPSTWTSQRYPDGGVLVEVAIGPSGDGTSGDAPEGAVDATLGGSPGWRVVRSYEPWSIGLISWSHAVVTVHNGYVYGLAGFFSQENPDDTVFLQIASSFTFEK
jgi:hypothetical protein